MFAQEDICIGKQYGIRSELLQEDREYQVYLPPSYTDKADKTYPVIYLLDGEMYFQTLVAVHCSFTEGRQPFMPESIIVGVMNTDRTRDLTPTASAFRRDGTKQDSDKAAGGGSALFLHFLTEELRRTVDKTYRTNGKNTLVGHSFGGLFVINALLKHTDSFDTYVTLDPSMWWDNAKLAGETESILKTKRFTDKTLYIGVARKMRPGSQYIHLDVIDSLLEKKLPVAIENDLNYYLRHFPDESHGSIPLPGMIDAFKQIYAVETQ
jgi:predicted alpha/beta superfamily hydrolase